MGLSPYKEGFLNKHYKGMTDKWSIHWCVVTRGSFIYWNDLETVRFIVALLDSSMKTNFII